MKKTLIASAVAAATFSGAALAQESNLPTVYGNIQLAVAHDSVDGGPSSLNHFDNGSTLGVLHDHEIAPGTEGFFKAELHFDADDNNGENDGIYEIDEAYVGVRGDNFGQIWVGKDDSTYETAVTEISEFFEVAVLNIGVDYTTGEGDLIQYRSPSFGGLTLGAGVQINGDVENADKSYPYQLAAIYNVDALELAVAVDSNDNGDNDGENTYGLRASYDMDALRLTGEFHTRKDVGDVYGVMGVYTLGANQFALAYEHAKADNAADTKRDTVTLQALHNVSDNLYVYVEGYLGGGDDIYGYDFEVGDDVGGNTPVSDERSIAAVGATYYF
ncbi:porin [Marinobacter sp.]|uniref:porin n=1 Tax=Marinobacter sp. TaxID=50741 RepID=UPI0034A563E0